MAEPKSAKPKPKAPASTSPSEQKSPAATKTKAKSPAAKPEAKTKAAARPKAAPQPKPKAAKSKSKSHSSADTYTDPALRDRLKDEITAGDKGGKPGQWSARKAQLLASEYEKAGGGYKNGEKKKTEEQKHLDSWTKEDWQTSDGKPAERAGGTTRYLPAEAWDELTPEQKKATNVKKQAGSKQGKQFVANTEEAKTARKATTQAAPASQGKPKAKPQAKPGTKPKAPKAARKSSK